MRISRRMLGRRRLQRAVPTPCKHMTWVAVIPDGTVPPIVRGNDALAWVKTRARSCPRLSSRPLVASFMSPRITSSDVLWVRPKSQHSQPQQGEARHVFYLAHCIAINASSCKPSQVDGFNWRKFPGRVSSASQLASSLPALQSEIYPHAHSVHRRVGKLSFCASLAFLFIQCWC